MSDPYNVKKIFVGLPVTFHIPWTSDIVRSLQSDRSQKLSRQEKWIVEHSKHSCSVTELFFQEKVRESGITLDGIRLELIVICFIKLDNNVS